MNTHTSRSSNQTAVRIPECLTPAPPRGAALLQADDVFQYRRMEIAFRASGGMANAYEVVARLACHTDQPISRLARWIVQHEALNIQWRSQILLPWFQFNLSTMDLRPDVTSVLGELCPELSDWEICAWFAEPNAWLGGALPVDMVDRKARSVLDAARAERYLLRA
ncbi:hypothetical protein [Variovorax sp. Sphag1AA]|uniref:hypothetical protein n=1 Tax=Variovorax sp. Sphag1AA TaxID=2587027 RepID=UPI001620BA32|nr:hypothetical protein [Variovorax sp. Sphag1AA]MBB3176371.1 hypothetical protein [Variovorax sp. Sphag1AA]